MAKRKGIYRGRSPAQERSFAIFRLKGMIVNLDRILATVVTNANGTLAKTFLEDFLATIK